MTRLTDVTSKSRWPLGPDGASRPRCDSSFNLRKRQWKAWRVLSALGLCPSSACSGTGVCRVLPCCSSWIVLLVLLLFLLLVLSLSLSLSLSSLYLPVCLSLSIFSRYLPACLPACLPTCLSVCLCRFVCLCLTFASILQFSFTLAKSSSYFSSLSL